MSSNKEKIIRLYVGELPLIKNIIERLGLREIFTKYIKPHKNEKIPAVVRMRVKDIQVTKLAGRRMQNHDRKLYPERIFYGLRQ